MHKWNERSTIYVPLPFGLLPKGGSSVLAVSAIFMASHINDRGTGQILFSVISTTPSVCYNPAINAGSTVKTTPPIITGSSFRDVVCI